MFTTVDVYFTNPTGDVYIPGHEEAIHTILLSIIVVGDELYRRIK